MISVLLFACLSGYFLDGETCVPCVAGTFSADSNQHKCDPCPPGRFSPVNGMQSCMLCHAGTFNGLANQTTCYECHHGFVSTEAGATRCHSCDVGTVARNAVECATCDPGYVAAGLFCDAASPGHFERDGVLHECEAGRFASRHGQTVCEECTEGYFAARTGATVCDKCDRGWYSETGATGCERCTSDDWGTAHEIQCYYTLFTESGAPLSHAGHLGLGSKVALGFLVAFVVIMLGCIYKCPASLKIVSTDHSE